MLHQVFVKGMRDLQPTDEHNGSHIVIEVIHQGNFDFEITDKIFEALSGCHLDGEEVIVILLRPQSGSVLVIESLFHLFETLE